MCYGLHNLPRVEKGECNRNGKENVKKGIHGTNGQAVEAQKG